jgi:hypothetical protein
MMRPIARGHLDIAIGHKFGHRGHEIGHSDLAGLRTGERKQAPLRRAGGVALFLTRMCSRCSEANSKEPGAAWSAGDGSLLHRRLSSECAIWNEKSGAMIQRDASGRSDQVSRIARRAASAVKQKRGTFRIMPVGGRLACPDIARVLWNHHARLFGERTFCEMFRAN